MSLDAIDSKLVPSLMLQVTEKEDEFHDVAAAPQHHGKRNDMKYDLSVDSREYSSNKKVKKVSVMMHVQTMMMF